MLRAKDDTEQYKNTQSQADISKGSSLTATGDINITAREQDITIQGSSIQGDDVNLIAKDNINILAGENTIDTQNKADSKSAGVGVSIGISKNNAGVGVSISGSIAKENSQEHITSYTPSTVNANKELTVKSGQETNTYQPDSKYAGGSITIGSGAGIQASAGVGNMDSDYASVVDQAGIYAGKEGFDITVGKNTDLTGAVIDSNATPDKNKLDTGTITFSDIENKAEYSASNIGVGIDTRPVKDPKNPNSSGADKKDAGVTPSISGTDGKDDSKTKSAVAEGTIEVKDKDKQKQDVADLSRDTKNANDKLDKIFDKDKILTQQELAKVFGEVGFKAAGDIINKFGIKEGSAQAIAIHGIIGGIMAELNGGGFAEGMSVAALNNLVISKLGDMKDENGKSIFNAAELRWISATVGATVSKAVGGNAGQGAGIADSATRNNWLTHEQQQAMLAELNKEDLTEDQKAEIYAKYGAISQDNIEKYGVRDEIIERELLDKIQSMGNYNISGNEGLNLTVHKLAEQHNNEYAAITTASISTVIDALVAAKDMPTITRVEWIGGDMASLVKVAPSGAQVVKLAGPAGVTGLASFGIDIANSWISFDGINFIKAAAVDSSKLGAGALVGAGAVTIGIPATGAIIIAGTSVYLLDRYVLSEYKNMLERRSDK